MVHDDVRDRRRRAAAPRGGDAPGLHPPVRRGFGETSRPAREKDAEWWAQDVAFFETIHSRAWIMVRRIAHTAHHRAEQTTLLRLLGRQVWSVYGPSVDTGGLPANGARTIYAYPNVETLIAGESRGGDKTVLPGPGPHPSTERSGPS